MNQSKQNEKGDAQHTSNPIDDKNWLKKGLKWGAFMFVFISLGFPYFNGDPITLKTLLWGAVLWPIGGLGYGYTMRVYFSTFY